MHRAINDHGWNHIGSRTLRLIAFGNLGITGPAMVIVGITLAVGHFV